MQIRQIEMFSPTLKAALKKEHKSSGCRPVYDLIQLLKIPVLQRFYNLSDDQTEFFDQRPPNFHVLLGAEPQQLLSRCKAIWLFRNNLVNANIIKDIFNLYDETLNNLT